MELYLFHLKDEIINRIKNIGVPLPKIHYNNDNSPYQIEIRKSSARALEKKIIWNSKRNRKKVLENHEYLSSKIASNQHVLFISAKFQSFSLVHFFGGVGDNQY